MQIEMKIQTPDAMEKSQPQPNNKDGYVQPEASVEVEAGLEYKDYRFVFMTNKLFGSREEALNWVKQTGEKNNMFFTIGTSKSQRVYIGCERSGKYRETKSKEDVRSRKSSGTKKINCPFQVKLQKKADDEWVVRIDRDKGKHNHELGLFRKCSSSAKKVKRGETSDDSTLRQLADDRAKAVELFDEACRVFKETASTADLLMATKTMYETGVSQDIDIDKATKGWHQGIL